MHRRACIISFAAVAAMAVWTVGAASSASFPLQPQLVIRIEGEMTIDAQGIPAALDLTGSYSDRFTQAMQQRVASWRFKPRDDGMTSVKRVKVGITLSQEERDPAHTIRFEHLRCALVSPSEPDVETKAVTIDFEHQGTVEYPYGGLAQSVEGGVLVYAHLTPEGRVDKAMASQAELNGVKGQQSVLRYTLSQYANRAVQGIENTRFHVVVDPVRLAKMEPDSVPWAFTVTIPVVFQIPGSQRPAADRWHQVIRTPVDVPDWLDAGTTKDWPGIEDETGGNNTAWHGCPRLLTPIDGTPLY